MAKTLERFLEMGILCQCVSLEIFAGKNVFKSQWIYMSSLEWIQKYTRESLQIKEQVAQEQGPVILGVAEKFIETIQNQGILYFCGNGGSAADAQHVVTELMGRFLVKRRALPAVALTTNTSLLTAIGNDYSFEEIFSRQVEGLLCPRDLLVGISTSGKSMNVIRAMEKARKMGGFTVAFTGLPGQPLTSLCDLTLKVPSSHVPYIQETHIMVWHIICEMVEKAFA